MSKNIEDIVDSVMKAPLKDPFFQITIDAVHKYDRNCLKQAITEGKLVQPMSKEDIQHILYDPDVIDRAQAIYEAQFGGRK